MSPKVAVVTRTHNRPLLLARALQSVGAQTFQDLVHIVVNDAGEPGAVEELVAALEPTQRERTQVIHNPVSAGREAAVNPGFARARQLEARYTVVLDDDDSWEPGFLEQTVAWMDAHPGHQGVATRTTVIYEEVLEGEVREVERGPLAANRSYVALEDILQVNFVPPVSLLFNTAALRVLHGWRSDLPVLADWDFFIRLLVLGPVGFVDTALANWHHRRDSVGAMGNSVVVEAHNHHEFHAIIREEYLRQALGGVAGGAAGAVSRGEDGGGEVGGIAARGEDDGGLGSKVKGEVDEAALGQYLLAAHYAKAQLDEAKAIREEVGRTLEQVQAQRQRNEEIMEYIVSQIQAVGGAQSYLISRVEEVQAQVNRSFWSRLRSK